MYPGRHFMLKPVPADSRILRAAWHHHMLPSTPQISTIENVYRVAPRSWLAVSWHIPSQSRDIPDSDSCGRAAGCRPAVTTQTSITTRPDQNIVHSEFNYIHPLDHFNRENWISIPVPVCVTALAQFQGIFIFLSINRISSCWKYYWSFNIDILVTSGCRLYIHFVTSSVLWNVSTMNMNIDLIVVKHWPEISPVSGSQTGRAEGGYFYLDTPEGWHSSGLDTDQHRSWSLAPSHGKDTNQLANLLYQPEQSTNVM